MKALLITSLLILTSPALADASHDHTSDSASASGDASAVTRTIEIKAGSMWFDPARLQIAPGATVRFRIQNVSMLPHEFSIGSADMQRRHQEMMQHNDGRHGAGHHGDGHDDMMSTSVTIEPGATQTLIWTAPLQGERVEYACFLPGHYEAGMKGVVTLSSAS
ncbi:plastocyanin/azurin family copper-binding protein [Salinicola endophyticus]|uniref:Plastocyanin/azurin family copper-binding protein n=1 Tax=Salinicola endophyticus TaxID=1949083 RepID=A0AB74UCY5_9GAMM